MAINTQPLIIEPHPETYHGYPFVTLIQFKNQPLVTIVDNYNDKQIKVLVLDLCAPERIDESEIIHVAEEWYNNSRDLYPISIEFSKRGLTSDLSKIMRVFNVEFVTRVIGPVPIFSMTSVVKTQRRKRKSIQPGVQIHRVAMQVKV